MSSTPPPTKNKKSFWGEPVAVATIIGAVIVTIGGIVAALIGGDIINVSPGSAIQPTPAAVPASTSVATPPSSPTTPLEELTAPASPEPATEVATYVDDYVRECRVDVLTAGSASINGTDYAHTILQWAGDTSEPVTIKRKAPRFKATVGIRDDASDQVRVKFELLGDGRQLFRSRELSFGESQKVDVSVEGVLRLTLRVRAVSQKWGYAGWGDARLTGSESIEC